MLVTGGLSTLKSILCYGMISGYVLEHETRLLYERQLHSLIKIDSSCILLVGGLESRETELLNFESFNIKKMPCLNNERQDCSLLLSNKKVFAFWGYSQSENMVEIESIEYLELENNSSKFWVLLKTLKYTNFLLKSLSLIVSSDDNEFYALGGIINGSISNAIIGIDPTKTIFKAKIHSLPKPVSFLDHNSNLSIDSNNFFITSANDLLMHNSTANSTFLIEIQP